MTEELDNSLLQSVESYLDERLRLIDEQLAKLQTQFNEAVALLRESAASAPLETTPLSATIAAHLQTAREQKLSGPTPTPAGPDLSLLTRAIDEIKNQRTQGEALSSLLTNAVQFADRAVLFVVKGEQAIGWRVCEARDRNELKPLSGVAVALSGDTVVSQAVRSGSTETPPASRAEDAALIERLGGDVQQLAALPLIVRKKVVAVIYVDSAWPHPDAIQLAALEVLARVAAMAVELMSPVRVVQAPQPTVPSEAAPSPMAAETAPGPAVPAMVTAPETAAVPEAPQPEEAVAPPPPVEAEAAEVQAEKPAAPPVEEEEEEEKEGTSVVAAPPEQAPPVVEQPVEAPTFASQYSAPLGTARRYGGPEVDLPIEVSEEERRLHNDARRFARLLVSEIKLYNEQKVNEGRSRGDIYDRLREDIDRSRQMYDKRVAPPVAARHDYFHQELVNVLAEGDAAKLGTTYPGAAVSVA